VRWARYVLASMVVAAAGAVVWVVFTPAPLFSGVVYREIAPAYPLLEPLGLPLLAFVAAVTGFLLPRGLWLWGVAAVSSRPLIEVILMGEQSPWSIFGFSTALFEVMLLLHAAVVCTVAAALGAGSRPLWGRLRGRSVLRGAGS
jgi:hypothetical protein